MTDTVNLQTLPLPGGLVLRGDRHGDRLTLAHDQGPLIQVRVADTGTTVDLILEERPRGNDPKAIRSLVYWVFADHPQCQVIRWSGLPEEGELRAELSGRGLLGIDDSPAGVFETRREAHWQQDDWLQAGQAAGFPEMLVMDNHVRHPVRPPKPVGEVYRRYDARLGSWISFRTLEVDRDLERFNRWQNKPRVNEFWEEAGTLDGHRAHLDKLAADPHCLQLIGCFDDEPFGFFDVYWAREDRIGPWCDAGFHDRGIHMLVGEDHHRGPHKIGCWLPSLVHYLFLDEPRTTRLVSEPRSDNDRMIGHLMNTGFSRLRDFNFPHKRAALMSLSRERFFDHCVLC